jgi:hypothetical protein
MLTWRKTAGVSLAQELHQHIDVLRQRLRATLPKRCVLRDRWILPKILRRLVLTKAGFHLRRRFP